VFILVDVSFSVVEVFPASFPLSRRHFPLARSRFLLVADKVIISRGPRRKKQEKRRGFTWRANAKGETREAQFGTLCNSAVVALFNPD
jgi:hypothetical protein